MPTGYPPLTLRLASHVRFFYMAKQLDNAIHVLDSSVWIELINKKPETLHDLCELVGLSVIRIAVPEIVRVEVIDNPDEQLPESS